MTMEKGKVYKIEYTWGSGRESSNAIVIVKANKDDDGTFARCKILKWIVRPEGAKYKKYNIKHTHPFCSRDIKRYREVHIDDELLAILL
jgi:hypothetical protein